MLPGMDCIGVFAFVFCFFQVFIPYEFENIVIS